MTEADKELEANITNDGTDPQLYELGYHFLPTLTEESLPEEVGKLKDFVEKRKGMVVSDQMPRPITLAYSIPKMIEEKRKYFDTALFGWIKFKMPSIDAVALEKELRHNKNILRFILIKTTEEKAVPLKKMIFLKDKRPIRTKKPSEKKKEPEKVLSEAELDKTIEELMVE
ncbi:MAG: 30S ribosomal protein S6 [Parcubacteria group bacterium]|nr:30S ribosomal protein S6 [Parcubacteria group bacterium]